ncbi:MAG: site-specific DNA-methyltransferase [Deltaproteobacteria bacterium]|nr:site-specific DNA-methyltransferase [Deltaproteobacteria bacterium]
MAKQVRRVGGSRRRPTPTAAGDGPVREYRHDSKRKNIPPAGLAAQGVVREAPKLHFGYNPHLPPVLRFDPEAVPDQLPELLEVARTRARTAEEARMLADGLRHHEPWLEWAGKREKKGFEVEPVALHIHERVATQAILSVAARQDVQRDFFADPQLEYRKAIQFYQHDVDWTNRMILGDSLQVMASLARREDLAGKVQMIYMDPPYGIKFASNFQPEIGKRDVKDKATDLTREPEMVKAYRDTWTLGVHSYLSYLRDRMILCRELLADTGTIFVQISDENLHRVRCVMDEVFGPANLVCLISFATSGGRAAAQLPVTSNYLLWYARDILIMKFRRLFQGKDRGGTGSGEFSWVTLKDGQCRRTTAGENADLSLLPTDFELCIPSDLTSSHEYIRDEVPYEGQTFQPGKRYWSTSVAGMLRLGNAGRLIVQGRTLRFKRLFSDFPYSEYDNTWTDTAARGFFEEKIYTVQTSARIIERCMLMTTDPGDLVLDPTCGSGTTAHVAEQWARRWVTIDTSRVALALARQRLLTARFDYYKLRRINGDDLRRNKDGPWLTDNAGILNGPCTFDCKTVPHVTLKSIAQNVALDAIFKRHQPVLDAKLHALNAALKKTTPELRSTLSAKLAAKERIEGRRAVSDADRRRWLLPKTEWREWEVPFDVDEAWPAELKTALAEYRAAWRAKMDEVNACIAANAEQEELVDQPQIERGVVRVAGPFTMEAVMPAEESLDEPTPIGGEPEVLQTFGAADSGGAAPANEPANAEAYLDKMLRLLRADGVRFPNNKVAKFSRLEPFQGEFLHGEGDWSAGNGERRVAVSIGPQFGPVTAYQVENALRQAHRRGFDDLVFAGFSFDGSAQGAIQDDPDLKVRCHLAHIRPDVNMGDLLKETPNSQLFTVFGMPRTDLRKLKDGMFEIEMQGVDIYNPVENTLLPTNADKVAAWFLDTDYDGRTFCITQAFFPDKSAWDKLARALKGVIDEERFAALSGTVSLPFPAGEHRRVAVKVIDPRGNEVMRVHRLPGGKGEARYVGE